MDVVEFSKQIRRETLRCIHSQGSGHVGGCLSIVDVLAVLYDKYMDVDKANPRREIRDRLVLSKGHSDRLYTRRWRSKVFSLWSGWIR